jgi:hypothetical protein
VKPDREFKSNLKDFFDTISAKGPFRRKGKLKKALQALPKERGGDLFYSVIYFGLRLGTPR